MRYPNTLLVGRYTDPEGGTGVQRVRLDRGTPVVEATLDLESPSWMERAGRWVLAVTEAAESRLSVLREDAGGIEVISTIATGGADACHLAVSPNGRFVAVAHYTSGSVRLLAVPEDGVLDTSLRDLLVLSGSGPDPDRQEAPHAHQAVWLDDETLLVNDLGTDSIRVVHVDASGSLSLREPIRLPAGTGPRHLVLRGARLAVVGELSGELLSLSRVDDGWQLVDRINTTGRAVKPQPSALVAAGDDLLVGNRVIDTVARVSWDAAGRLSLVGERPCPAMPRDVVSLGGRMIVAGQEAGLVAAGPVDGAEWDWTLPAGGAARVLL